MNALRDRQLAEHHMLTVIRQLAGEEATPRGDQLDAVEAIIQPNARVLVVQATGWGKSAVYWAATSALRSIGLGPTLVVSPLLALGHADNQPSADVVSDSVSHPITSISTWAEASTAPGMSTPRSSDPSAPSPMMAALGRISPVSQLRFDVLPRG